MRRTGAIEDNDLVELLRKAAYHLYYVRKADAIGDEITSAENDMKFERVASKLCRQLGLEYSDSIVEVLEMLGIDDYDSPKWKRITDCDIYRAAATVRTHELKVKEFLRKRYDNKK